MYIPLYSPTVSFGARSTRNRSHLRVVTPPEKESVELESKTGLSQAQLVTHVVEALTIGLNDFAPAEYHLTAAGPNLDPAAEEIADSLLRDAEEQHFSTRENGFDFEKFIDTLASRIMDTIRHSDRTARVSNIPELCRQAMHRIPLPLKTILFNIQNHAQLTSSQSTPGQRPTLGLVPPLD